MFPQIIKIFHFLNSFLSFCTFIIAKENEKVK
nr:MAG TPA: coiled coil protein [Caudoviricetes sp.]